MKTCPVCSAVLKNQKVTYCSVQHAALARKGTQGKTGSHDTGRVLPEWGAAYLLEGEYYKIGHLDKVFRWGITEWMTSCKERFEIERAQFGRFWGGRFKPEVRA